MFGLFSYCSETVAKLLCVIEYLQTASISSKFLNQRLPLAVNTGHKEEFLTVLRDIKISQSIP